MNRFLIITLLAIGTLLTYCSDGPTAPEEYVPSGYPVYLYDNGDNPKWYVYYPEDDYLDSAYFSISNGDASAISPDGNRIYWSNYYNRQVVVLDPHTGERLPELMTLTGRADIEFSPDMNRMLFSGDGWFLLDYQTQDTIAADSASIFSHRRFSMNGEYLYDAIRAGTGTQFSKYDGTNLELIAIDTVSGLIPLKTPVANYLTADQSKWYLLGYLYTGSDARFCFVERDMATDAITVLYENAPNYIDFSLRVTNDRHYLVFTNPGDGWDSDSLRPCRFLVFDLYTHTMADTVSTKIAKSEGDTVYFNVEQIALTPDSKYLVGMSDGDGGRFVVYNMQTLAIERWVELSGFHSLSQPLCQSKL